MKFYNFAVKIIHIKSSERYGESIFQIFEGHYPNNFPGKAYSQTLLEAPFTGAGWPAGLQLCKNLALLLQLGLIFYQKKSEVDCKGANQLTYFSV